MTNFMNLDATRLQNTVASTRGNTDQGASPARSDVAAFDKAMRSEDSSKEKPLSDRKKREGQSGTGQTSARENPFSKMSNPLDSLFGKPAHPDTEMEQTLKNGVALSEQDEAGPDILPQMGTMENPFSNRLNVQQLAQTAAPQAAPPAGELIDTLVDRILLSQSKDGNSEIRISLNNTMLPDTEIRLVRGNDGQLTVQMLTNNASSFQTLVTAQDTLRLRLEQQEVNVRVEVSSQTEQENNDSRRQSRGYIEENHES